MIVSAGSGVGISAEGVRVKVTVGVEDGGTVTVTTSMASSEGVRVTVIVGVEEAGTVTVITSIASSEGVRVTVTVGVVEGDTVMVTTSLAEGTTVVVTVTVVPATGTRLLAAGEALLWGLAGTTTEANVVGGTEGTGPPLHVP